jgi:hypothetical protein
MNNKSIYHQTKEATYFDNGDGSLEVVYRGSRKAEKTIVKLKNDEQGRKFLKEKIIPLYRGQYYLLYRCPNDGQPYSNRKVIFSRRGNVSKSRGLVIDVRRRNPFLP